MPQIFLVRWNGGLSPPGFEVLLQRRSGKVGWGHYDWCWPGGSLSRDEKAADETPFLPSSARLAIRQRAAVREFVEECGGDERYGRASSRSDLVNSAFLPQIAISSSSELPEVRLPRAAIPPSLADYCLDSATTPVAVGNLCFMHLLCPNKDRDFSSDSTWQPRALARYRGEVDEAWNAPGSGKKGAYGHVWVPFEYLLDNPEAPVEGSSRPLAGDYVRYGVRARGDEFRAGLRTLIARNAYFARSEVSHSPLREVALIPPAAEAVESETRVGRRGRGEGGGEVGGAGPVRGKEAGRRGGCDKEKGAAFSVADCLCYYF